MFTASFRRAGALILIPSTWLFIANPVLADVVVLRDGTTVEGVMANRGTYLEDRLPGPVAGVYVPGEEGDPGRLQRFEWSEVDYIVLDLENGQHVVDPGTILARRTASTPVKPVRFMDAEDAERRPKGQTREFEGALLLVAGLSAAVLGIAVKFGGPELTVTETNAEFDEETYNAANYALMAAGLGMVIGGMVVISSAGENADLYGSLMPEDRPIVLGYSWGF